MAHVFNPTVVPEQSWKASSRRGPDLVSRIGTLPWRGRGKKDSPGRATRANDGLSVAFLEPTGGQCYLEGEVWGGALAVCRGALYESLGML